MLNSASPVIELEKFVVTVLEPGILENRVKPNQVLDVADVEDIKKHNIEMSGNQPYAVLVVLGYMSSSSKEARELSASKKYAETARAKALLTDSMGQRIIANFYIRVQKPHAKTKIFNDREQALTWLRQQVTKPATNPFEDN